MSQYHPEALSPSSGNLLERTGRTAGSIVRGHRPLGRELLNAVVNLPILPWILFPMQPEPDSHSEFLPGSYTSLWEYFSAIAQVVVPTERKSASYGNLAVLPPDYIWPQSKRQTKWFLINGICTSPSMALLEAREVALAFQRPIHLIHTPTAGFVRDIAGALNARALRKDGRLSRPAYNVVRNALLSHDQVVLVTYSQGAIVASYIARKMLKDPQLREHAHKLEIYSIGGAADSLHIDYALTAEHGHTVPYVEHFANGKDFFARVGILAKYHSTSGPIFFVAERKGHMLNPHYIKGIVRGDYCDGRSRLSKYANGGEPGVDDYIPFDRRR